jgi:hypothetical protein
MNLIDKRPGEAVLSELLPYVSYDEYRKLFWLTDGSASRVFSVVPKSCLSFTEDEFGVLRAGLASVLNQVSENTFIQFLMIREKTNPDNDLAYQNWKRAHVSEGSPADVNAIKLFESKDEYVKNSCENGNQFQTKVYISVRTSPYQKARTGSQTGVFSNLIFNRGIRAKSKSSEVIEAETNQNFETLKLGLDSSGFEIAEPTYDELFKILFRFLNPGRTLIPLEGGN